MKEKFKVNVLIQAVFYIEDANQEAAEQMADEIVDNGTLADLINEHGAQTYEIALTGVRPAH